MTHKELIEISAKWLYKHSQNALVPNCATVVKDLVTANGTGETPDVLGFCYWTSVLIEVKVSRSDFLKDRKKVFRNIPENGAGEFRYYCCSTDLIKKNDLPEHWGLLYCNDKGKIKVIKLARKQEYNYNTEKTILLSIIRRYKDSNK